MARKQDEKTDQTIDKMCECLEGVVLMTKNIMAENNALRQINQRLKQENRSLKRKVSSFRRGR